MGWSATFQDEFMYSQIPGYESTNSLTYSDKSLEWLYKEKDLIPGKVSKSFLIIKYLN